MNHAGRRSDWAHAASVAIVLVACGADATETRPPEAPSPEPTVAERAEPAPSVEPAPEEPAAIEAPIAPAVDAADDEEVRRAFEAMLPELESMETDPVPADCSMGCVYQNTYRLISVMPLAYEGSGAPMELEVRVEGSEPLVRTVTASGSDAAWEAFELEDGPPPWLRSLRRAMPTLEHARPATDLAERHVVRTFGLSEHAVLVELGGGFEGRYLFVTTTQYAHHIYLVFGSGHQLRWLASLPLRAESWDGAFLTTTCVQPIGIQHVYQAPGSPSLLLQLVHPSAGHDGIDRFTTLLVAVDDGASLTDDDAQAQAEIEASLSASGPRVRAFSAELREAAACDTGCVYFREDHTFAWAFPERLDGHGAPESFTLRQLDGTISPRTFERETATIEIEGALGEGGGTLARDLIARSVVASWNGVAHSPLVELGRPHMPRRLSFVSDGDQDVLFWLGPDTRTEVGRLPRSGDEGPWGIDRVLAPEGAGYPLIVVATAAVRPGMGATEVRHRVALLTIDRIH
jgi:hypothetical protein